MIIIIIAIGAQTKALATDVTTNAKIKLQT